MNYASRWAECNAKMQRWRRLSKEIANVVRNDRPESHLTVTEMRIYEALSDGDLGRAEEAVQEWKEERCEHRWQKAVGLDLEWCMNCGGYRRDLERDARRKEQDDENDNDTR